MKLKIILASVRKERLGDRVTSWVTQTLDKESIKYELLDLKEYTMPFVDGGQPFSLNKNTHMQACKSGQLRSMKQMRIFS